MWPVLRLVDDRRAHGVARVQRAVSVSMRLFVWLMKSLGLLTYEVRGREKLAARGQFVVANHPTLIDVVFLVGLMPEVDCIVKQALWRNVFLRWPVYWAGYISNATGEGLVAACAAALRADRSLVVFPEGTRTRPGEPLELAAGRGADRPGRATCDLRPVTITCDPITLIQGKCLVSACRRAGPTGSLPWASPSRWRLSSQPASRRRSPRVTSRRRWREWFDVSVTQQLGEMRTETRPEG